MIFDFKRSWVFASRVGQVEKRGDVEPRETPALTCPYHAWSFDLDGSLKGRPHYHGPDRHDQGNGASPFGYAVCLFEVRSAVWHDWVFVNLDGAAQDFDAYRQPLSAHFDGWDLSQFRYAHHEKFKLRCNWKLAVENFCDTYHVFKIELISRNNSS